MICLDVQSDRHGNFSVILAGAVIVQSTKQPLFDGARELLRMGHHPETMMTTRNAGSGHDNFVPKPIKVFADLTAEESTLRIRKYQPMPVGGKPAGA